MLHEEFAGQERGGGHFSAWRSISVQNLPSAGFKYSCTQQSAFLGYKPEFMQHTAVYFAVHSVSTCHECVLPENFVETQLKYGQGISKRPDRKKLNIVSDFQDCLEQPSTPSLLTTKNFTRNSLVRLLKCLQLSLLHMYTHGQIDRDIHICHSTRTFHTRSRIYYEIMSRRAQFQGNNTECAMMKV